MFASEIKHQRGMITFPLDLWLVIVVSEWDWKSGPALGAF